MPPDQDMTLAEYMTLRGADPFRIRVVDAVVCNDRCTSAARAGLREQLHADHGMAGTARGPDVYCLLLLRRC